jgi:hypothetical protein
MAFVKSSAGEGLDSAFFFSGLFSIVFSFNHDVILTF